MRAYLSPETYERLKTLKKRYGKRSVEDLMREVLLPLHDAVNHDWENHEPTKEQIKDLLLKGQEHGIPLVLMVKDRPPRHFYAGGGKSDVSAVLKSAEILGWGKPKKARILVVFADE